MLKIIAKMTPSIRKNQTSISLLIILLLLVFGNGIQAQQLWTIESTKQVSSQKSNAYSYAEQHLSIGASYKLARLNTSSFHALQANFNSKKSKSVILPLPLPDGTIEIFQLTESSNMHPDLQAKFPEIKSYKGVSLSDASTTVSVSFNHVGIDAYIRKADDEVIRITHGDFKGEKEHIIFYQSDIKGEDHVCGVIKEITEPEKLLANNHKFYYFTCELITFDLAFAITPGLANLLTDANGNGLVDESLALINNKVTMLNENFGRELSVHFQLVANNDQLMFTDLSDNPYTETGSDPTLALLAENQEIIDDVIGENNYDVGHLLWTGLAGAPGGRAALGVVCDDENKARAVSNTNDGTVLHEFGHQFDAEHTFGLGCDEDNINSTTAHEVGCGSTIMSYGSNRFLNFHASSLSRMYYFLYTLGSGCKSNSVDVNDRPLIYESEEVYVPISTPYILYTEAWSNDGDEDLTYSWDQIDARAGFIPSKAPSKLNQRYVPEIWQKEDVAVFNEEVPSSNKEVDIFKTVRDNNPAGGCMDIKWQRFNFDDRGGPFRITSAGPSTWLPFQNYTITWDVANTDGHPFNVNFLEVWLAFDGRNFNHYVGDVSNDGSASIYINPCFPNTTKLRVMLRAKNSTFYDFNDYNITFNSSSLTVNRLDDFGSGSLRSAIECANVIGGKQLINIDPSVNGTLTLSSLLPDIEEPVRIDGQNANLVIDANGFATGLVVEGLAFPGHNWASQIYGLTIENFTQHGIRVNSSNKNWIGAGGVYANTIYNDFGGTGIYLNNSDQNRVFSNSITNRGSAAYGISINNSFLDSMYYNEITGYDYGISVGNGSYFHKIKDNAVSCSNNRSIRLDGNANLNIAAPTITDITTTHVTGTGTAHLTVEIYISDSCNGIGCDGYNYIGSAQIDGSGNWSVDRSDLDSFSGCTTLVAKISDILGDTSEFSACFTNGYCVTNTNDSGPGSLRAALLAVNNDPTDKQVKFKIPGSGTQTIYPLSALPAVGSDVLLSGTNFGIPVQLDGSNLNGNQHGLIKTGNGGFIKNIKIRNFPLAGIFISGTVNDFRIENTTITENGSYGIVTHDSSTQSNIIIYNNKIGTDSNDNALGNGAAGIRLSSVTSVTTQDNVIAYNGANGIHSLLSSNLLTTENKIYCNVGAYGIFDVLGSQQAVEPPVITSFENGEITGTGIPGAIIEVFSLPLDKCGESCAEGGNRQVDGNITVPTNGIWSATANICGGYSISATQRTGGHTSDFSWCSSNSEIVVTNTNSFGTGSLLWAIECANDHIGYDRIVFNVLGSGPHIFELPTSSGTDNHITDDYTVIDATTQPDFTPGDIIIQGENNFSEVLEVYADYFEMYGCKFDYGRKQLRIIGEEFIVENNIFEGPSSFDTYAIYTTGSDGLIENNTFYDHESGVVIANSTSLVELTNNSFTCNEDAFEHTPNFGGDDPFIVITNFTSFEVSGSTYPDARVEIYAVDNTGCSDVECQGDTYLGSVIAFGGLWTLNADLSSVSKVTAIAYSTDNGMSDFADCVIKNTCLEVTSTSDGGEGSLREAIICANNNPGPDEIYFNLPGNGPYVIDIQNPLPKLTDDYTIINASTQTSWSPGYITIEGGAQHMPVGLHIEASHCAIYGLRVFDFWSSGIFADGNFSQIGDLDKGNVIVGNGGGITAGTNHKVNIEHNYIGVEADGTSAPNNWDGISLTGLNNFSDIFNNTIGNNGFWGIEVGGTDTERVTMKFNSIYCNGYGGIRLFQTANDDVQAPTITSITEDSITGIGNNNIDFIQLYEADTDCGTPGCQGKTFLGNTTADQFSEWVIYGSFDQGKTFTAMSTDDFGNTSEFSECSAIQPSCLTVTNTNDSGAGSLRDAIDCANSNPLFDRIVFDIPGNVGPYTINLNSTLPNINGDLEIDATTQPDYYPGMIIIDGSAMTSGSYGMTMSGDNNSLFGLQMQSFSQNAIRVYSGTSNAQIGAIGRGNYFCDSGSVDIQIFNSTDLIFEGNHFGETGQGVACGAVAGTGISGSFVGGEISYNSFSNHGTGIFLTSGASDVLIRSNAFFCNSSSGIRFATNSVNNGVQAPTVTLATSTEVSGIAQAGDYIEVYYSDGGCAGGLCEGEESLGITIADASGNWTLGGSFDSNESVTATATTGNSTSRFSNCMTIPQICPEEMLVQADLIESGSYQASDLVISGSIVEPDATVDFKSGIDIVLESGFETTSGCTFTAVIETCPQ
jgi:hypothetical protein